jgi:hypothetical protein
MSSMLTYDEVELVEFCWAKMGEFEFMLEKSPTKIATNPKVNTKFFRFIMVNYIFPSY